MLLNLSSRNPNPSPEEEEQLRDDLFLAIWYLKSCQEAKEHFESDLKWCPVCMTHANDKGIIEHKPREFIIN